MNAPRGSGKSFRSILAALYAASATPNTPVYFITSQNQEEAKRIMMGAINVIMGYLGPNFYQLQRQQRRIRFTNGSTIYFMTIDEFDNLRGYNDQDTRHIIED